MKNKLITADELSEISGKTKRAIYKNKNLPYDDSEGQRLYDLENKIIKKWLKGESIRPVKKPATKSKRKTTVNKTVSKKIVKLKLVNKTTKAIVKTGPKKQLDLKNFEIDEHLKKLTDSGQLTFAAAMGLSKRDLEKIKMYEQIKEIKTKADQRREGLIDKKLVRIVFSKIYEIDMNQFLPLKDKLIPDLAAIFGSKDESAKLKAAKKTDDELWKILNNVKRMMNRFLIKVGEEEI